jgi:hypothetical protein
MRFMKKDHISFLVLIFVAFSISLKAQKVNRTAFGLNITHFSDWKNRPLNFFNPEINFSKSISENQYIYYSLNAFYNKATAEDNKEVGNIIKRLILTSDIGYRRLINNFSFNIGPSLRYRNETKIKYFYPQINPFEIITEPKKGYFDFGGFSSLKYNIPFNKKSMFQINVSYHLYSKGANPISLGLFYEKLL